MGCAYRYSKQRAISGNFLAEKGIMGDRSKKKGVIRYELHKIRAILTLKKKKKKKLSDLWNFDGTLIGGH